MKKIKYFLSVLLIIVSFTPFTHNVQAEEDVPDIIIIKPTNNEDDE